MQDPLSREYGVLLGTSAVKLMEKAFWFRRIAKLVGEDGSKEAEIYMNAQADRAEETVIALGRKFDEQSKSGR